MHPQYNLVVDERGRRDGGFPVRRVITPADFADAGSWRQTRTAVWPDRASGTIRVLAVHGDFHVEGRGGFPRSLYAAAHAVSFVDISAWLLRARPRPWGRWARQVRLRLPHPRSRVRRPRQPDEPFPELECYVAQLWGRRFGCRTYDVGHAELQNMIFGTARYDHPASAGSGLGPPTWIWRSASRAKGKPLSSTPSPTPTPVGPHFDGDGLSHEEPTDVLEPRRYPPEPAHYLAYSQISGEPRPAPMPGKYNLGRLPLILIDSAPAIGKFASGTNTYDRLAREESRLGEQKHRARSAVEEEQAHNWIDESEEHEEIVRAGRRHQRGRAADALLLSAAQHRQQQAPHFRPVAASDQRPFGRASYTMTARVEPAGMAKQPPPAAGNGTDRDAGHQAAG